MTNKPELILAEMKQKFLQNVSLYCRNVDRVQTSCGQLS